MKDFINKINNKEDLTLNEMQEAINSIMSGMSDDDDIESFLIGLNEKGVSETEVCLLYTSPSPRDRQKSRMPSSA